MPAKPRPGARPGTKPGPGNRPGNRPGVGNRPGGRPGNRPVHINNQKNYLQNRSHHSNQIRNHFNGHPSRLPAYGHGRWGNYPHGRWHLNNHHNNWWKWASVGALTGWVAGGWGAEPAYYNYGDNSYYEAGTVYYEGEPVATAEEYAAQAQTIATSAPEVSPDDVEWLPLGVFALTQDGDSADVEPTVFLQLAVSKEGILAGTVQNTATDKMEEIEGTIDKESGRAAWVIVGKDSPIMESGIANLTQEEVPALLHFADGTTQQWLLVRLEEPKES